MVSAGKSRVERSGAGDAASLADTTFEGASLVDAALVAVPSDTSGAVSAEVASTPGSVSSLGASLEGSLDVDDGALEPFADGSDAVVVSPGVFEFEPVEFDT